MSGRRKKTSETTDDGLIVTEIEKVLKSLKKQMEAKKKLYFRYKGIVMVVREVPDHATQLRAAVELGKLLGLYPGKGDGPHLSG